jgi:Fe2+ transport system protein B
MNENNKYIVSTKCGHVGSNKYIVIDFAVSAASAKVAARIARNIPRVKHHWKNAIEQVREVTPEEYYNQIKINNEDDYLKSQCIQDQRKNCEDIIEKVHERYTEMTETDKWKKRRERIQYQMKKLDIIKRYSYVS